MLRTAWSPKATATAINLLQEYKGEREISCLLPTQYPCNSDTPNTHTLLSLSVIYIFLKSNLRLESSSSHSVYMFLFLFSIYFPCFLSVIYFYINLSSPVFLHNSLAIYFTAMLTILSVSAYPSASLGPFSIIHLGYNRSIISNNTSVVPSVSELY